MASSLPQHFGAWAACPSQPLIDDALRDTHADTITTHSHRRAFMDGRSRGRDWWATGNDSYTAENASFLGSSRE